MTTQNAPLIILAAGGTGGHVFPAEALAAELQQRGYRLALLTDKRGNTYSGVLGGLETYGISAGAMTGKGLLGKLGSAFSLLRGILQAKRLLAKLQPRLVVGFGGYPSIPTMFAATSAGYPTLIHEQNAVLGRANRLLAGKVKKICTSFQTVDNLDESLQDRIHYTGMPVRPAVTAARDGHYPVIDDQGPLNILVLGGSQGAQVFSDVLPEAFAKLPPALRSRLQITQQCRAELLESTREAYARNSLQANLDSFFSDVPSLLKNCHLLIARAGASTVAEATAIGRPALLVPYPYATDDHQSRNAHAVDEVSAGWLMPQQSFTAQAVADRLQSLLNDPHTLTQTAQASYNAGRPNAGAQLADAVEEMIEV